MVPAQRPAAPNRDQPRVVEGIDHQDQNRQIEKRQPKRQRHDIEGRDFVRRTRHYPGLSSSCRCSRSYNKSGATNSTSSTRATADATGQSLLVKNSSHSVWPIIMEFDPASKSGTTNSPTIGMKHSNAPAHTPGSDNGNV